jgi:adenylate kinase
MEIERKEINVEALKSANLPIIWILGGPGSGKGTQCDNIRVKLGFTHLSSGDLLRNEVVSGSKRGLQLYRLMEMGELVPAQVVMDLIAEAMVQEVYGGKAKGFLLDAFPWNLEQAEAFVSRIGPPKKVIYLSLEQDVMIDRLLARGNFDDTKETIEKRCANFQNLTRPVLDKYKDMVARLDANRGADEVTADIMAALA